MAAVAGDVRVAGQASDVRPLGQDRALVAVHLLHGPVGALGGLLRAGAGTDHRLHLGGAHRRGVGAGLRVLAAKQRTQRVVDREAVLLAAPTGQQQVRAVLVDADEVQVGHVFSKSVRRPARRRCGPVITRAPVSPARQAVGAPVSLPTRPTAGKRHHRPLSDKPALGLGHDATEPERGTGH